MDRQTVVISLDGEQLKDPQVVASMQKVTDAMAEMTNTEIDSLMRLHGWSIQCAQDVVYLRSRNRWTQELEDELIRLHSEGVEVNIYEFGVTPETQRALLEAATNSHM